MDVERRTARRSSPQRNQDINIGLSRTQPLPARAGDLSSTGGTRKFSTTTDNAPIIRSDPYDPANRKWRANGGALVHEDNGSSLSTSTGDGSISSPSCGSDLSSTSRRTSLSPSEAALRASPVCSQDPQSLTYGGSASQTSRVPSTSPSDLLSTSGNDLALSHRRSPAASISHVTVDSKRNYTPGHNKAMGRTAPSLGSTRAKSFAPLEDVIPDDFAKACIPGTPYEAEARKEEAAQEAAARRLAELDPECCRTLEGAIWHEPQTDLGWRDSGNFICMRSAAPDCHGYSPYWVSFSKNNKYLVSGGHDGHVKMWDANDMAPIRDFVGHTSVVLQCFFVRSDEFVVSLSVEEICVWYVQSQKDRSSLRFSIINLKAANTVSVSPDGRTLVYAGADAVVRVWDLEGAFTVSETIRKASFDGDISSFCTHVLPSEPKTGHTDRIVRAAIAPNSVHLLTCSFDKTIILWDLRKGHGKPMKTFQGHKDQVLCVSWHESGLMFASSSHDGVVMVWRTDLHVPIHILRAHEAIVYTCVYLPESNRLVTAGNDTSINVWDTRSGVKIKSIPHIQKGMKPCLAIDALGLRLAVASSDKIRPITLWHADKPPPLYQSIIRSICFWLPDLISSAKTAFDEAPPPYSTPANQRFEQPTVEDRHRADKARNTKLFRRGVIAAGS